MKKFFLISQVFYPDEVSTAGLFTDLCSTVAKDGFNVEVWCAQPSYTHSGKQPRLLEYQGMRIRYLPSTRFHKSKLLGRMINIMTFMISSMFRLMVSREKTPVFTHTTPPFMGIVLSFICSLRGRKFIYIMQDIYPEGMIRLGKLSSGNIIVRLWQRLFVDSLERSERIIVLGRDMGEYLEGICSKCSKKIDYIPHWQDEKLITPLPIEGHPFVMKYKLEGKFIVQYSGNMGLWNDMKILGEAVNINLVGVHYVFIGGGMRKKELLDIMNNPDPENVLFLPFQPREILGEVLTGNHVSLVSLRTGLEGMAVPSKIYGILAAGVPVIAMVPADSEIAMIIREENCGFVVESTDIKGMQDAILTLMEDEELRINMGRNGRKAFESKYTTKVIANVYTSLITDMAKQDTPK